MSKDIAEILPFKNVSTIMPIFVKLQAKKT